MHDTQKAVRRGLAPTEDNGFGQKIRSYVLAPEKRVIDHRTGVRTSDVEAVLDGDLDQFIHAALAKRV